MKKELNIEIEDLKSALELVFSDLPDIKEQQTMLDEVKSLMRIKGLSDSDAVVYVFGPQLEKVLKGQLMEKAKH